MTTLQVQCKLVVEDCPSCYVLFAMPEALQVKRRQDGKGFYCPSGHSMSYTDPENARLKKQLSAEVARRETAQRLLAQEREEHAATQRREARMKKRIAHGVCPCCKRSFKNLRRHMATQHPEVVKNA